MAKNYQRVLDVANPQEKVQRLKHLYSLIVRTLTITLVSQYLIIDKEKIQDSALNDLLLAKFPQLTSEAWLNLFFASVKVYGNRRVSLFMLELYELYWNTSQHPHTYKIYEENALKRLGQLFAEIEVERNTSKSEMEWNSKLDECEELLFEVFKKFRFLENYELIRVAGIGIDEAEIEVHKGIQLTLSRLPIQSTTLQKGFFYWRHTGTTDLLPLHPFLVFWDEIEADKDVAVYDKYIPDRLQYLLTLLGKTVVNSNGIKEFVNMVIDTLQEAKRKQEQVEKLEWVQSRKVCASISEQRMSTVSHKYKPDLYLQRSHAYESFVKYLRSDKRVFVLVGKSGVGKSNFILSLADELRENQDICLLMYDGAQLKVNPSMHKVIADDFNERLTINGKKVDNVWQEINKVEEIDGKKFVLFVDAINENPQASELLRQLDSLAQSSWSWIRIVLTCRPETWQVIRRGVKLAEGLYYQELEGDVIGVELQPFSYSEKLEEFSHQELNNVYEKYKAKYLLKSQFKELSSDIKKILCDPLNLWLISNIYQYKAIPKSLAASDLVGEYLDSLVKNNILWQDDFRFLEKNLIPLMMGSHGRIVNNLTITDIDEAGNDLYESVFSEQVLSDGTRRNHTFTNLVDAGVLVKSIVSHSPQITFKYERFYEHFAGNFLVQQGKNEDDQAVYFSRWVDKIEKYPFIWGAVKIALVQMARRDDKGLEVLKRLSFTEKQNIKELMVVVLIEVGQNNLGQVESMLSALLKESKNKNVWLPFLWSKKDIYERSIVNMKKIIVEAASFLELTDVIVNVAGDRMPKVQSHAEKYAYYIWLKNNQKGYEILEKIGKQTINNWVFLDTRKLDFFINLAVLIFFKSSNDESSMARLQRIIQDVIKRIFFVDVNFLGISFQGLDYWLREMILRLSIKIVLEFADNQFLFAEGKRLSFTKELRSSLVVTQRHKATLERIINYAGDVKPALDDFRKDVIEILDTQDVLACFLVVNAFMRQIDNYGHKLLPLIEEIYHIGMVRDRSAIVPHALHDLYWGYLYKRSDEVVRQLLKRLEKEWVRQTKGDHIYGSERVWKMGSVIYSTFAELDAGVVNYEELPLYFYIQQAIHEKDFQFIANLIGLLEEIAIPHEFPGAALYLCKPIIGINDPYVSKKLIGFLASTKQHYPYAVDNFLLENNCSGSFIDSVYSAEASEHENLIFIKAASFFCYDMIQTPSLWKLAAEVYRRIIGINNLEDAIIVMLKELINNIYGDDIFTRK